MDKVAVRPGKPGEWMFFRFTLKNEKKMNQENFEKIGQG